MMARAFLASRSAISIFLSQFLSVIFKASYWFFCSTKARGSAMDFSWAIKLRWYLFSYSRALIFD